MRTFVQNRLNYNIHQFQPFSLGTNFLSFRAGSFLLVFQDLFTRSIELKPLRATKAELKPLRDAKAVARALEKLVLFRWETPDYFLPDNGKEFVNKFLDEILKEYRIKHVTTPYHSQTDPVERRNRTLRTIIATFVESDHRDWDTNLHAFRHTVNTATQATTRVSPAFLNFGRQPKPVKSLRREVEQREVVVVSSSAR